MLVDVTLTPIGGAAATQQVTIEPGYTVSLPVPAGDPVAVSITADGEVLAAATTLTPTGALVVPVGPADDAPAQTLPAEQQPSLR